VSPARSSRGSRSWSRQTSNQRLLRIEKAADGGLSEKVILPVAFVPLITPPADPA
jgi:hypothetical protein